jgi:thiamine biosynthesis protein ThiS
MRVVLNGEPREVPGTLTVADLVAELGLLERRIAVELNRDILARERYATQPLRDGDVIEIVHFVGGG